MNSHRSNEPEWLRLPHVMKSYGFGLMILGFLVAVVPRCIVNPPDPESRRELPGNWQVCKLNWVKIDLEGGEEVSRTDTSYYYSSDEAMIMVFNDSTAYRHFINTTVTGSSDATQDSCYAQITIPYTTIGSSIYGSTTWVKTDSDSSCLAQTWTTDFGFLDDSLVLTMNVVGVCDADTVFTSCMRSYFVAYGGAIPPSTWPEPCE